MIITCDRVITDDIDFGYWPVVVRRVQLYVFIVVSRQKKITNAGAYGNGKLKNRRKRLPRELCAGQRTIGKLVETKTVCPRPMVVGGDGGGFDGQLRFQRRNISMTGFAAE